jgi:hypothetical protein
MEGQEEWLEPSGEAMVILSKLFLAGAFIALVWGGNYPICGESYCGHMAFMVSGYNNSLVESSRGILGGRQAIHSRWTKNARARHKASLIPQRQVVFTRTAKDSPLIVACLQ